MHLSALADPYLSPGARIAPYVRRDVHADAAVRWRRNGRLLIVGEAQGGATRLAYELALDDEIDRVVLSPQHPGGLRAALAVESLAGEVRHPALTFLDHVERFGPDDLTGGMLDRLQQLAPGSRILATIPTAAYAAWSAERADLADRFEVVRLSRGCSATETERLHELYPGLVLHGGIGPTLTGLGRVVATLRGGLHTCSREAGAECELVPHVLRFSTAWRLAGSSRPLPLDLLTSQVGVTSGMSGSVCHPDHIAEVLGWLARAGAGTGLVELMQGDGATRLRLADPLAEALAADLQLSDDEVATAWEQSVEESVAAGDEAATAELAFAAHMRRLVQLSDPVIERDGRQAVARSERWLKRAVPAWGAVAPDVALPWLRRAQQLADGAIDTTGYCVAGRILLHHLADLDGPPDDERLLTAAAVARAHASVGETAEARECLELLEPVYDARLDPEVAQELHLAWAWVHYREASPDDVVAELSAAEQVRSSGPMPLKAEATVLRAELADDAGDWRAVIDLLEPRLDDLGAGARVESFAERRAVSLVAKGYRAFDRTGEATRLLERQLARLEARGGQHHRAAVTPLASLSGCYADVGRWGDAVAATTRQLDLLRLFDLVDADSLLVHAAVQLGNGDAAASLATLDEVETHLGRADPADDFAARTRVAATIYRADALVRLGRADEARPSLAETERLANPLLAPDHYLRDYLDRSAAFAHHALGEHNRALDRAGQALRRALTRYGEGNSFVTSLHQWLALHYPDVAVLRDGTLVRRSE